MDLKKLKVDKFSRFQVRNFPKEFAIDLKSVDSKVEVILFYIDKITDVDKFVTLCKSEDLVSDNRVIMVYKKGRNDGVNRDSIIGPFKEGTYSGFAMKAPMLCSISDDLSAFVQQKVIK